MHKLEEFWNSEFLEITLYGHCSTLSRFLEAFQVPLNIDVKQQTYYRHHDVAYFLTISPYPNGVGQKHSAKDAPEHQHQEDGKKPEPSPFMSFQNVPHARQEDVCDMNPPLSCSSMPGDLLQMSMTLIKGYLFFLIKRLVTGNAHRWVLPFRLASGAHHSTTCVARKGKTDPLGPPANCTI